VLGPFLLICYEDRKNLPYTNDTTLQGFPIPKVKIVHFDMLVFCVISVKEESPRQFSPSRFLAKKGNFVSREAFLPFSTGSRVCLGEQLARSELFIFFANLLRAFTFTLPKGVKKFSTKLILGSTMQPQPYKLCVVPRGPSTLWPSDPGIAEWPQ
uniref:Uncharacterized protein n=1 Tax=Gopherus agassizii TaxID=38772 RepID=A0A452GSU8_9SAUR